MKGGSKPLPNLKQYKHLRCNRFPLPSKPSPQRPADLRSLALLVGDCPQSYELHPVEQDKVVMFNDHEFVKRRFDQVWAASCSNTQIANSVMQICARSPSSLVVVNALDSHAADQLLFSTGQRAQPQQSESTGCGLITSLLGEMLTTKSPDTVVNLSIVSIKADGSLNDELNYKWLDSSEYIEDLVRFKNRAKLQVHKINNQVKVYDLTRQEINSLPEAAELLGHYFQIKDYLQTWKLQSTPSASDKVGEIYELSEDFVNKEGEIIENKRRTGALKINQFMPSSSLVSLKTTQFIKNKLKGTENPINRDCAFTIFMNKYFSTGQKHQHVIMSQIGTNESIKQEIICMNMDLQLPGEYLYLKNYCDRAQIIQEVKQLAHRFVPMTVEQKSTLKLNTLQAGNSKRLDNSIRLVKQTQRVTSKLFSVDTYSSLEKKRPSISTHFTQEAFEPKHGFKSRP